MQTANPIPQTLSGALWRHAAALRFEDLPPPVIEKVKELVLDTLGVALGSSSLDFGVATRALVASWGCTGASSVIGQQARVPPHAAALVCHGGSGTLLGGLAASLPMVLVPFGADQPHKGFLGEILGFLRAAGTAQEIGEQRCAKARIQLFLHRAAIR